MPTLEDGRLGYCRIVAGALSVLGDRPPHDAPTNNMARHLLSIAHRDCPSISPGGDCVILGRPCDGSAFYDQDDVKRLASPGCLAPMTW